MKKITITSKDISTKQWTNLLLELNLIKKAWKPYALFVRTRCKNLMPLAKEVSETFTVAMICIEVVITGDMVYM